MGWTGWISLQSKGLSSFLQHHSSKASVLWCSAFFIVQLSHPLLRNAVTTLLLGAWKIRPEGRLPKSPVSLTSVQRGADVFSTRQRQAWRPVRARCQGLLRRAWLVAGNPSLWQALLSALTHQQAALASKGASEMGSIRWESSSL